MQQLETFKTVNSNWQPDGLGVKVDICDVRRGGRVWGVEVTGVQT